MPFPIPYCVCLIELTCIIRTKRRLGRLNDVQTNQTEGSTSLFLSWLTHSQPEDAAAVNYAMNYAALDMGSVIIS